MVPYLRPLIPIAPYSEFLIHRAPYIQGSFCVGLLTYTSPLYTVPLYSRLCILCTGSPHLMLTFPTPSPQRASSSIMFTRLDAERNAKIMKRATNEDRVSQESYSEMMSYMEEYVSLPAKRLAYIVRRYSHHCAMKEIGRCSSYHLERISTLYP